MNLLFQVSSSEKIHRIIFGNRVDLDFDLPRQKRLPKNVAFSYHREFSPQSPGAPSCRNLNFCLPASGSSFRPSRKVHGNESALRFGMDFCVTRANQQETDVAIRNITPL